MMEMLPRLVSGTLNSLSLNADRKSYRYPKEPGNRLPGTKSCGEAIGRNQLAKSGPPVRFHRGL
jgi:hypothetical protein